MPQREHPVPQGTLQRCSTKRAPNSASEKKHAAPAPEIRDPGRKGWQSRAEFKRTPPSASPSTPHRGARHQRSHPRTPPKSRHIASGKEQQSANLRHGDETTRLGEQELAPHAPATGRVAGCHARGLDPAVRPSTSQTSANNGLSDRRGNERAGVRARTPSPAATPASCRRYHGTVAPGVRRRALSHRRGAERGPAASDEPWNLGLAEFWGHRNRIIYVRDTVSSDLTPRQKRPTTKKCTGNLTDPNR